MIRDKAGRVEAADEWDRLGDILRRRDPALYWALFALLVASLPDGQSREVH